MGDEEFEAWMTERKSATDRLNRGFEILFGMLFGIPLVFMILGFAIHYLPILWKYLLTL